MTDDPRPTPRHATAPTSSAPESDIPRQRLARQRLVGEPLPNAVDVVRWFGAVQAQDYGAAKWAIAQRTRDNTEADVDGLFDEGLILRSHVLRPTWHLVLPADLRWMLALTGPRIRRRLVGRYRELGIDREAVLRANAAFTEALRGGKHLSRAELGQVLSAAGLAPDGQRLPHFLMAAELEAVIVSGPRRGKQFTYALFDERVPRGGEKDSIDAVVELARRYFRSHGPAQLQDFVWWSGLTLADANSSTGPAGLRNERVEGRHYWSAPQAIDLPHEAAVVHLLPNFDEYTVGYTDRSNIVDASPPFDPAAFSYGNILSNVVTVDGRVRGAWRSAASGNGRRVELRLLATFQCVEMAAVEYACRRLSHFLGRALQVAISPTSGAVSEIALQASPSTGVPRTIQTIGVDAPADQK